MADRSDFIRQRRNLIIVSLVLIFVELSGIEVKKINLFGNELDIINPEWVNWALWIGLIYWGYRYYTYFLKQDTGFGNEFWGRMDKRIVKQAVHIVLKNPERKDKISEDKKTAMKKASLNEHSITYRKIDRYIVNISTFNLDKNGSFITVKIKVSGHINYWIAVKSMFNLLFNTTIFTEYILPFILFAISIFILLYMRY